MPNTTVNKAKLLQYPNGIKLRVNRIRVLSKFGKILLPLRAL
jgi:hypothetical protein